jgi:ribose transport system permease protein
MNRVGKSVAAFGLAFGLVSAFWRYYSVPLGLSPFPNRFLVWFLATAISLAILLDSLELTRRNLLRLAGVTFLLAVLLITLSRNSQTAFDQSNVFEVLNRQGALGVIAIGAALVIITGGIDLSMGSVLGFAAVGFGVLLERGCHPLLAVAFVLLGGSAVGAMNGLLVTRLRLQAFLVTLCGMFVFRGLARELTNKQTGLVQAQEAHPEFAPLLTNLRAWLVGRDPVLGGLEFPGMFVIMMVVIAAVAVLLHKSAYGRYWYAIGYNDQAARYAGINIQRQRLFVYMACSGLAALGGILTLLYAGSADPSSAGNTLELYAITAAVLGGVSLKGGEGTALGIALGALVQPVIYNLMVFLEIRSSAEPWVIGLILLIGTIVDELLRRQNAKK